MNCPSLCCPHKLGQFNLQPRDFLGIYIITFDGIIFSKAEFVADERSFL